MADPIPSHRFSIQRAEERWIVSDGEPRLAELRAEMGSSRTFESDDAVRVEAVSRAWFPAADEFGGEADRLFAELLDHLPHSRTFLVRRVIETREAGEDSLDARTTRLVSVRVKEGGGFLVPLERASVEFVANHIEVLSPEAGAGRVDPSVLPLVWLHGSGSVLLHEAIGHPAEVGAESRRWPSWLRVRDDPQAGGIGDMDQDDCGRTIGSRELTEGEVPDAWRRESYRDVPLRRMTNLMVESEHVLRKLPSPRLEVLLLGGGDWDIATDEIRIRVSAARLVGSGAERWVLPFVYRLSRSRLPQLLVGSFGNEAWYPGVMCGDEGQRVPVGSRSPILVTKALRS